MRISNRVMRAVLIAVVLGAAMAYGAGDKPLSQRAADAAIARWPDGRSAPSGAPGKWTYELGTLLQGMDGVWHASGDPRYLDYIRQSVDGLVTPDGTIPTYKREIFELDSILLGRQLLVLYKATHDERYMKAATLLYDQLLHQPLTPSGGFWHKQRYPNQMWLDGLYMAEPFYAEYAAMQHHPEKFAGIEHQFVLIEQHARDPKTGLLYHGWDESKQQRWANKATGDSPEFWARGMGWYMMALVDTLDYLPKNDAGRAQLIAILQREADAVAHYQDASTGLWYQVINKAGDSGNYLESSAACMFVYALARGVERGYLPAKFMSNAERGYHGIVEHFVKSGQDGDVSLTDTVKSVGLGGDPYRDGTYAYYIGEPKVTNDTKGVGAFLMASAEMEHAAKNTSGAKPR